MNEPTRHVKGIGEVSIRVTDLDAMHKFYEEVIGLEVIRQEDEYVFFKVTEGYGGHTQNLALFDATYVPSQKWGEGESLSPTTNRG